MGANLWQTLSFIKRFYTFIQYNNIYLLQLGCHPVAVIGYCVLCTVLTGHWYDVQNEHSQTEGKSGGTKISSMRNWADI